MKTWPELDVLQRVRARAGDAARHFRLPFQSSTWSGTVGNWAGTGVGSSIDFQDHRPYLPGDDPRYIDWQAYARSGHYVMKLYREEVSPRLDLVLDNSASMRLTPEKTERALELFYFCYESARRCGAALRVYALGADPAPSFFQSLEIPAQHFPTLGTIPWRPGSLRVLVSDLLFPGDPDRDLHVLRFVKGRAIVFAPYDVAESDPDWDGNLEFVDCETSGGRIQRVDAAVRERYAEAYRRHFELWREAGRRLAIPLVRVPAEPSLSDVLRTNALVEGAAEVWT